MLVSHCSTVYDAGPTLQPTLIQSLVSDGLLPGSHIYATPGIYFVLNKLTKRYYTPSQLRQSIMSFYFDIV